MSDDEKMTPNVYDILMKTNDQIAHDFNKDIVDNNGDTDQEGTEEIANPDDDITSRKTSLYQRLFSKMEAGSLRGSIFAMSSLALGTGCLALPQKFEQMSFVAALVILILGALASYWSLTLLIKASSKMQTYDYSALVKKVIGKAASLFLDVNIMIYIIGILISYQCISK
jgi:Ca2+/Na+ antiporter